MSAICGPNPHSCACGAAAPRLRFKNSELFAIRAQVRRLSPPLILIIEDSLDQLELYEFALRDHYQVRKATHGVRGVEVAIAEQPDVVLVDICMPGIDGWEVCRRLKGDPRTAAIPIILLTALDGKDTAERAIQVGAAALLMKPCNVDTLREEIEAATHA
jgi:CheY-like chemotaxis protein